MLYIMYTGAKGEMGGVNWHSQGGRTILTNMVKNVK